MNSWCIYTIKIYHNCAGQLYIIYVTKHVVFYLALVDKNTDNHGSTKPPNTKYSGPFVQILKDLHYLVHSVRSDIA